MHVRISGSPLRSTAEVVVGQVLSDAHPSPYLALLDLVLTPSPRNSGARGAKSERIPAQMTVFPALFFRAVMSHAKYHTSSRGEPMVSGERCKAIQKQGKFADKTWCEMRQKECREENEELG
ncbi:hypothetical protein BaRGS_00032415 [Batillaria attramentaria]|uniref:Uncharacterized protein n=1 Tax=Batillaria attramentaria TaxID=370345 RepID=A0ABD0JNQ3_9CAEN